MGEERPEKLDSDPRADSRQRVPSFSRSAMYGRPVRRMGSEEGTRRAAPELSVAAFSASRKAIECNGVAREPAVREQVYGERWTVADLPTQPVTTSPTDWPPPSGSPHRGFASIGHAPGGTLRRGGQECSPSTISPVLRR